MQSLNAYLRRIGLDQVPGAGDPTALSAVHRAHATSIPFENLDPLRGVPASLEPDSLERKLVGERRGGFCFEHTTLLAAALTELGYEVAPMLARVGRRDGAGPYRRDGGSVGEWRPLTHMLLRVRDRDGGVWHADVGFGAGERGGTLLEPIPFGPGGEYEQAGWRYRVEPYRNELVLMARSSSGVWSDMYSFVPEPAAPIDIEVGNWFASTYPGSPFTRRLVVAGALDAGAVRMALSDDGAAAILRTLTPTGQTVTEVAREALPDVLAQRFGLRGWRLDGGVRPVPAAAGSGPAAGGSVPAAGGPVSAAGGSVPAAGGSISAAGGPVPAAER
jgi:N-hydroxyarylamine O-acetyltransferase